MKIHHLGIAVDSLGATVPVFEKILGEKASSQETVDDQKVQVAVFQIAGSRIELLEPTSPDSPVAKFLAKHGPGVHHLALAVPDLAARLAELHRSGVRLVNQEPRRGAGNERIAFLHPSSTCGVLIELVEENPPGPQGR